MKLLITTITIIFISFGANARSQFDIIEKLIPARECVKALENGKYIGKSNFKGHSMYLLDGYLYQFRKDITISKNSITSSLGILDCLRSNKIY